MVQADVFQACKGAGLQGFECVRKIRIHHEPFSSANGFATPTFKLVRDKLKAELMGDVEAMYAELEGEEKEWASKEKEWANEQH
jgi:long-subunit acyl-CoA synthetase (AMP-forming)